MSEQQEDDKQLLRAYVSQGDESAFAKLIRRHGGIVQVAARNVVGDASMAEDIVQATFLALARKARKLCEREGALAGWLYRVGTCLARDARRNEFRRKVRETEAGMYPLESESAAGNGLGEVALATLFEELGDLAEKYRQPVILHHLEGMSYAVAAPLCNCTEKTFSVRLSRGREQLRKRLTKRGVTLGATALVGALGQSVASAAPLSDVLVAATCKAAVGIKTGGTAAVAGGLISAKVAALMDSAMKLLFWEQVKIVAVVCSAAAVVCGGGIGVAVSVLKDQPAALPEPTPPVVRTVTAIAPPDPVAPITVAATAPVDDGDILFQDSFENGLGKWNQFGLQSGVPHGATVSNSPDIRVVQCQRDGRAIMAAELTRRASNGPRVGIAVKPLARTADSYVISYEYTYEGRPRKAMEGLDLDLGGPSPSFSKPARPAGEWNQVRWECERKIPARGDATLDARLYFNGEYFGSKEYLAESSEIGFALMVVEGQFRFANVVIREIKK